MPDINTGLFAPVNDLLIMDEASLHRTLGDPSKAVAIDTETTGLLWWRDRAVCLSYMEQGAEHGYVIPASSRELVTQLLERLRQELRRVIMFNSTFDQHILDSDGFGIIPWEQIRDAQLTAHLANNDWPKSLDQLGSQVLQMPTPYNDELAAWKRRQRVHDYSRIPLPILVPYAEEDARLTMALYEYTAPRVPPLSEDILHTEHDLLEIVFNAEKRGIRVDPDQLGRLITDYQQRCTEAMAQLEKAVGFRIEINKRAHIIQVLKDRNVEITEFTGGGDPSTAADTLQAVDDEVVQQIIHARELDTVLSILRNVESRVDWSSAVLHPSIHQVGARTGRMSCRDPNLQQLPDTPAIRAIIIPSDDHVLLTTDYKQIEMVLFAMYAQCESLIRSVHEQEDIHTWAAAEIHGVSVDEVTKAQRDFAKTVNFGIIYGQGLDSLAIKLGVSRDQAKVVLDLYYTSFPEIRSLRNRIRDAIEKRGFIYTAFGRYHHLPTEAAYKGLNHLIQGCAADLLKTSICRVNRFFPAHHAHHLLWVHDEILAECPVDQLDNLALKMQETMTDYDQLTVPIYVDIKWSTANWGDMQKWQPPTSA